ncbi:hypothetical protein [Roseospirillum parvum]|uniref:Uncharacterized protein n=1 Tax=Roseospirillum parvum TaxID=83401 RepID=A0A1G7YAK3_9PROT|nr:hypothetical protein [Roseospirillum parvum]SDG93512.1 hypothetical protein SAMN05421742_103245 [Roseospirillum parvum]
MSSTPQSPTARAAPSKAPPPAGNGRPGSPTPAQAAWLARGLDQPGGKLPLFDTNGRKVNARMIRACLDKGWAEPWFANPVKPDWLVCRLTEAGRRAVADRQG